MNTPLNLGILDFCDVHPNQTDIYSLSSTIELARHADALGYSRYWLAEHHEWGTAHASPELLIPVIAGLTQKIRVGTAGVLLSFYSPLKVADNFKLLELLFSERIDLGIARGLTDESISQALLGGKTKYKDYSVYQEKVDNLIAYLHNQGKIPAKPYSANSPEVWVLGSGNSSMPLAAQNGVAYSHSLLHSGFDGNPLILQEYRETFQAKSGQMLAPKYNIAIAGICAETETDVQRLLKPSQDDCIVASVTGTPSQCKKKLQELQERYEVDEIIFMDLCRKFEDRVRSYELLAAEFGLMDRNQNPKSLAIA